MPSPSSGRLRVVTALSLLLLVPTVPAVAAETSTSEFVIIREDDVVVDDLYAGAIKVIVEGTLDGDLIVFAAEEVVITGTVTGSVFAVSARVRIEGAVEGSVRAVVNDLVVTGSVAGDIVAAAADAELASGSSVTGDFLIWAMSARALGDVGADLTGTQRVLRLGGTIGGDVDVSVGSLEVVDDLVVTGDLGYRSDRTAEGLDRADVGGAVVGKTPLPPNLRVRALALLGRFLVVLFLAVAALSAAYGWPNRTTSAVVAVGRSPIKRWLAGFAVLVSPLVAILITGLLVGLAPPAAALPLLAVLVPLILALVGVVFALALIAGAPVAGWLGGILMRRLDLYGSLLVGSMLIGAAWFLPYVGWLVPLAALPLGLGSWFVSWRGQDGEFKAI